MKSSRSKLFSKTLIGVAAFSATAGAFADYSFYGLLDDAYYKESKVSATSTASKVLPSTQTKMFSAKDNSRFGLKGDKEFTDGLKGIYQFEAQLDQNSTTLFGNNRTAWVGLESDKAGAVRIGNMDTLIYNVFSAMDVNGRLEYKPQLWRNINGSFVETSNALVDYSDRTRNTINYTSPAYNGFVAKLEKAYAATANDTNKAANTGVNSTGGIDTSTVANGKNGQMSGYAFHYDQGPIAARVVRETWLNTGMNSPFGTTLNAGAKLLVAPSLTDQFKREVNALTYDLGVAKLSLIQANAKLANNYVKTTTYGVKVPVDKFAFAVDMGTGTYSGSTLGTATVVNSGKLKDTTLGAYYSLNKEATLYLVNSTGKNEQSADGVAYSTPGSQKFMAAGINYKF